MRTIGYTILALVALFVLVLAGNALGLFGDSVQVAREEFGPRPALQKYEWFKDAANQIKAKQQDIQNYTSVLKTMDEDWKGVEKKDWPREINQEYSQRKSELAGLITAYNSLIAEYTAASEKFNWSPFEDKVDSPPKNFEAYKSELN